MIDKNDGKPTEAGGRETGGSPAGAVKRPHATLDLKATEIKSEAEKAKPAAEDQRAAGAKSGAAGDPATPAGDPPGVTRAGPSPVNRKPSDAPPSRGISLVSHLAAGLLGGTAVLLAGSVFDKRAEVNSLDAAAAKVRAQELEQRVVALEKGGAAAAPDPALAERLALAEAAAAKVSEVEGKLAKFGEAQGQLAAETKALGEKVAQGENTPDDRARLGKLEERLGLLAAGDPGADGGRIPQLAAITGKISDLETSLGNQIAELRRAIPSEIDGRLADVSAASEAAKTGTARIDRELAGMKTEGARAVQRFEGLKAETERLSARVQSAQEETAKLATQVGEIRASVDRDIKSAVKPGDLSNAVGQVSGKLTALERNVQSVVKSETDRRANAERIVLSLELANLKRALDRGLAYTAELTQVRNASGGRLDLAELQRYEREGVPSLAELEAEFRPVMHAAIDAEAEPSNGSVFDRLVAGAKSVVRVRKVNHDAGDTSAEAIISRVEAALKEGRLGVVLSEAKALPPASSAALEPWLAKVRARHSVDSALETIEAQLKSSLAGNAADAPDGGAAPKATP